MKVEILAAALAAALCGGLAAQQRGITVELDTPVVYEGRYVTGTVSTSAAVDTVTLEWVDAFGDTFATQVVNVRPGAAGRFSIRVEGQSSHIGTLLARGRSGVGEADFAIVPREDAFWEGFVLAASEPPEPTAKNALLSRFLGVRGVLARGSGACLSAGKTGLRPIAEGLVSQGALSVSDAAFAKAREEYAATGDTAALVREPSLSDAQMVATFGGDASRQAAALKSYVPAGYVVGENASVGRGNGVLDLSFAASDLEGFALYLSRRFETLNEVSGHWGERLRNLTAARPWTASRLKEAVLSEEDMALDISPWALHREYMDGRLAATIEGIARAGAVGARTAGEDGFNWSVVAPHVGLTGVLGPGAYGGYDWSQMAGLVDFVVLSGDAPEWSWGLVRDISRPGKVLALVDASADDAATKVWTAASEGLGGVVLANYDEVLSRADAALAASRVGAPAKEGAAKRDALVWSMTEGRRAAQMASLGEREAGVALVYSHQSVRAGWMAEDLRSAVEAPASAGTRALEAWSALLSDMGIDYQWVTTREVELGALTARGYSVVVLPEAWCLSEGAAEALEAYTRAGGRVVADCCAGLLNGDYTAYSVSPVDALFGIQRNMLTFSRLAELSGAAEGQEKNTFGVEGRVARVARGIRAGAVGAVRPPANRLGSGFAAYLNTRVSDYTNGEGETKEQMRTMVHRVLADGGEPLFAEVRQSGKVIPARVRAYRWGGTRILFVDIARETEGFAAGEPVEVSLSGEANVYNLRPSAPQGKALGRRAVVEMTAPPEGPIVLAQSEVTLTTLLMDVVFDVDTIYVNASLEGDQRVGDRLFLVEVYDPAGNRLSQLERTVQATNGVCAASVRLPESQPDGVYQVLVRDLASGMASWRDVLVE